MARDRVVLCMKWGTLYSARYVNVLFRAVADHLDGPFRFVCLTDDAGGLDEGIESFPIPDLGLPDAGWRHGAWPKLSVFGPDLHGLRGRCLFIDLDSVIVGRLEPFFDLAGTFNAIGGGAGWRRDGSPSAARRLLTGVFAFDLGALGAIRAAFMADPSAALAAYPNEQAFVEGHIAEWSAWPADWVISFKRHLRRPLVLDLVLPVADPPPATRIVAFHGDPRPIDLVGRLRLWADPPHFVRCPVGWLDDYWKRYGA